MNNLERFKRAINWEPIDHILTYDFVDCEPLLVQLGGYDHLRSYSWENILELSALAWKNAGLDVTRYVYDPASHWMGGKIVNWIRFFHVDPNAWEVRQTGGTAWISKRPFTDLRGLEKNMPQMPVYEEVREWYAPVIKQIQDAMEEHDIVYIGALEGPLTDAYTYIDMELFCTAIYDAPELVAHVMDCCGMFSAHIARAYAEVGKVPLLFMGEDISSTAGPIFRPDWVRQEALPRWRWIADPVHAAGMKFLYHSDGRYGKFLPLIFDELGADGSIPSNATAATTSSRSGMPTPTNCCLATFAALKHCRTARRGTFEDETLELIEKIGPQGGIFIGSSSEVHDLVPLVNTTTMYRVVHEYGHYPIDVDRIRARRQALRNKGQLDLRVSSPI